VSRRPLQSRRASERNYKSAFPTRGLKADDAPLNFLASLLIFRVLPKETQTRSQFGTLTRKFRNLEFSGSLSMIQTAHESVSASTTRSRFGFIGSRFATFRARSAQRAACKQRASSALIKPTVAHPHDTMLALAHALECNQRPLQRSVLLFS
jgi:hypothetical protein